MLKISNLKVGIKIHLITAMAVLGLAALLISTTKTSSTRLFSFISQLRL